MADWFEQNKPKAEKPDWFAANAKPPGIGKPPQAQMPEGVNLATGTPFFASEAGKPIPRSPGWQKFEQEHPHLYSLVKSVAEDPVPVPIEMDTVGSVASGGAKIISGKILDAFKNKFGPELAKAPKETQSDIAFALFKENHGAAPTSASEKVKAIKEMREALKSTPKPKAAVPKPEPAPKSPSWKPADPPPPPPKPAAPPPGKSASWKPAEPPPPPAPKPTPPVAPVKSNSRNPYAVGPGTTDAAAAKPSPKGKLTAPEATASGPGASKTVGGKSDIDTTTGEVVNEFTNVKRDTVAKAIVENEKLSGEQFLKLSTEEQNKLIKKYWPKHELKPNKLTKDPAKLKEYADRIDKLRASSPNGRLTSPQ